MKDDATMSITQFVSSPRICLAVLAVLCVSVPAVARPQEQEKPQSDPDAVKVGADGRVELHVFEMPIGAVLRMLSMQTRRNIVATPAVQGAVTADLYRVTFEEALQAVLTAIDCGYRERGGFIYIHTLDELAAMSSAPARATKHRVFPLNYITAADAGLAIGPLLSEQGSVTASTAALTGIASNPLKAGGNTLAGSDYIIVYDEPDRFAAIADVLRQIDVKPRQVLVEATILRVRLSEQNALGVDFTLLGGIDFRAVGATAAGVRDLNLGTLPSTRFDDFASTLGTNFNQNVPAGGMTVGIITNQAAVFIRALEEIADTSVIANPKILALNKQVGNVIVGRRDGYLTTTVTETQAIQEVQFLETGTQLTFRPFIGSDGFVRMELHPEDSVGGLTAANLPFEQTTEVTTNVIVRDGHTILIGGLFREVDRAARSQIPFLGDLPLIGNLFRSRNDELEREEVIILLTVHIIKHDDAYTQAGGRQLEDVERVRVGLRRGLGWTGRERLAQAHYRRALEHFATGDSGRALWDVRLSLHNNPQFLPAINLREEILHQREWDDEGSITRDFVARLIDEEASPGVEAPRFGRPAPPFVSPKHMRGPSGFESVEEGSGP
ncbi:MAG: hypothetical protein IID33_08290 [Planctomycetes bacterium]|nr:hypothetical protein [Planctomycetota bacterium]